MATKNPFVSALEGWAVDPEAEAKGSLYRSQQGKLGAETDILRDRLAARQRFLETSRGVLPEHIRNAQLANEVINANVGEEANRTRVGMDTLFTNGVPNENLSPQQRALGMAALGFNPNDQTAHMLGGGRGVYEKTGDTKGPDLKEVNGVWYQVVQDEKGLRMVPVLGQKSVKVNPAVFPGDAGTTTTTTVDAAGPENAPTVNVQSNVRKVEGSSQYNPAQASQILSEWRKSGLGTMGNAALTYPTGPFGYMLDRAMHRLNERGDINPDVMGLNSLQASSVIRLAERLSSAGYPAPLAFSAALEAHPEIQAAIQSGRWQEMDFSGTPERNPWIDWLRNNTDLDARGAGLPNLGGTFRVTPGFATNPTGDYSNLKDRVPVSPMTVLQAQPDVAQIVQAGVLSGIKPSFASPLPPEGTPLTMSDVGRYFYSGTTDKPDGFFVARMTPDKKVIMEPITGLRQ